MFRFDNEENRNDVNERWVYKRRLLFLLCYIYMLYFPFLEWFKPSVIDIVYNTHSEKLCFAQFSTRMY